MSNISLANGRLRGQAIAEFLVVAAVLGWWLTARSYPPQVFPSPYDVGASLLANALSLDFWLNAGISATRIVLAVAFATLLGTAIGILPRYVVWMRGVVDDVLIPFLSSFPGIAWAILGTVWFGLTPTAILIIQTL